MLTFLIRISPRATRTFQEQNKTRRKKKKKKKTEVKGGEEGCDVLLAMENASCLREVDDWGMFYEEGLIVLIVATLFITGFLVLS